MGVDPSHPSRTAWMRRSSFPTEMYGEHFNIPQPDELVFISWFGGGEVFRSGCCYRNGKGRSSTSSPATGVPPSTTSRKSSM